MQRLDVAGDGFQALQRTAVRGVGGAVFANIGKYCFSKWEEAYKLRVSKVRWAWGEFVSRSVE